MEYTNNPITWYTKFRYALKVTILININRMDPALYNSLHLDKLKTFAKTRHSINSKEDIRLLKFDAE